MSERKRRLLFLAAALVAGAAVVLISSARDLDRNAPDSGGASPPDSGPGSSVLARRQHDSLLRQVEHRDGPGGPRQVARRFLEAFINYQDGRPEQASRELVATATHRVAVSLLRRPPRPVRSKPSRARLSRLYMQRQGRRAKASALIVYGRRRETALFEFSLEQLNGRWRVADLYP
jgi:hypothetical protein